MIQHYILKLKDPLKIDNSLYSGTPINPLEHIGQEPASQAGSSWKFLVGVYVPSSFQNPDPFSHPFSGLASDINFCFQTCLAGMMTVIRLECQQKEFLILKCISKSHITCSFLSIWNYSDLKHRRQNGTMTPTGSEILLREPSEHA